jgi:hypothetical protein
MRHLCPVVTHGIVKGAIAASSGEQRGEDFSELGWAIVHMSVVVRADDRVR